MSRNLSQVGNPGWASMGDGMKPECLPPHVLFLCLLKHLLLNSSSCFFGWKRAIRSRERREEVGK